HTYLSDCWLSGIFKFHVVWQFSILNELWIFRHVVVCIFR
uniref:Uncharacterized protein n=1 Tax=Aegilops tauschii subsp. strangulata TaxID=200361 RepID=A0A453B2D9_AEGTS